MGALIFDLDGTLIDTVYAHVIAWQRALAEAGIVVEGWRIHRRVGMGVQPFLVEIAGECGHPISPQEASALKHRWGDLFRHFLPSPLPSPGAVALLHFLRSENIPHGIATGSQRPEIDASLAALGVSQETVVVQGNEVLRGKPDPDLFLACASRLGSHPEDCTVVCDGLADLVAAKRAGMRGVGLLTGGQFREEMLRSGADHVFRDPAELQDVLEQLGFPKTNSARSGISD